MAPQEEASLRLDALAARYCPSAGKGKVKGLKEKVGLKGKETCARIACGNALGTSSSVRRRGGTKGGKSAEPAEPAGVPGVSKERRRSSARRSAASADAR